MVLIVRMMQFLSNFFGKIQRIDAVYRNSNVTHQFYCLVGSVSIRLFNRKNGTVNLIKDIVVHLLWNQLCLLLSFLIP